MEPDRTQQYIFEKVRTTCLLVIAILALGAALTWLRSVVVPFLIAVALYYIFAPISDWLARRWHLPTWAAVAGSLLAGVGGVVLVGFLVASSLSEVSHEAELYAAWLDRISANPDVLHWTDRLGLERDPETNRLILINHDQARRLTQTAVGWFQALLVDTFLILVFLLFMLLGRRPDATASGTMFTEVSHRVRRYLIEMFAFSLITGLLVGGILGALGVRFSLSFGFLAFVLNFIPSLGPIAATLLPLPIILIDDSLPLWAKILAFVLPGLVQVIVGNVIQPRFQSHTQGIHPVVTMLALIIFGTMWGLAGAVLAVPVTGAMKIAFERIPGGEPFAELLAGKLDRW